MKKKIVGILVCTLVISGFLYNAVNMQKIIVEGKQCSDIVFNTFEYVPMNAPPEEWNLTYGGCYQSWCSVFEDSDGNYIIVGTENVAGNYYDALLVKVNKGGAEVFRKTYGGDKADYGWQGIEASDGGYVIAGDTYSYAQSGSNDAWLFKTNKAGVVQWNKVCCAVPDVQFVRGVSHGLYEYILAGSNTPYPSENSDYFIATANSDGQCQFWMAAGTDKEDAALSVCDEIVVGYTGKYDPVYKDIYYMKVNINAQVVWEKTYGKQDCNDYATSISNTNDGKYVITGCTNGFVSTKIFTDAFLIKIDGSNGNRIWEKTYGGDKHEWGRSVQQTSDGGFIIAGWIGNAGIDRDALLTKTDSDGNELWNTTFGGPYDDWAESVIQTSDGGYLIAGFTESYGSEEIWLIKVKSENQAPGDPIILGPLSGKIGTLYDYNFTSIDPDGDDVSYYVKWGDGSITDWTAFQASGPPGYTEAHAWDIQDTYTIEAKAKDTFGAESDWAELVVTMPRSRALTNSLFYRLLENFPILQKILLLQR